MDTLQESKLKTALQKAKNVGRIEEPVTIAGCSIVLQSLSPDEYEAINEETKELEDMAYLHAYQIEHLCRSIVEVEGIDLRGMKFIEVDGEGDKKVKLERHAWLRDEYLRSWGREAIVSAWRKMLEVFAKADEKAKEGIQFSIAEETDEGRFRRLIGEMKEAAGELPDELVLKVLDEEGLMLKATKAELDAVNEALKTTEGVAPEAPPQPTPAVVQNPNIGATASLSPEQASALMANRVPLNRQAVDVPPPQATQAPTTVSAGRRVEVPPEIRQAAVPVQNLSRADRPPMPEILPPDPKEIVEIKRPAPVATMPVIDGPPATGINTRYQPPRRP